MAPFLLELVPESRRLDAHNWLFINLFDAPPILAIVEVVSHLRLVDRAVDDSGVIL